MLFFFFFNDTATTEIYTLSLHDALPISQAPSGRHAARIAALAERPLRRPDAGGVPQALRRPARRAGRPGPGGRSEEHTSELQSQSNLVCRLLLEKKKIKLIK